MSRRPTLRLCRLALVLWVSALGHGLALGQSSYSWTTGTSNPWGGSFWTRTSGSGSLNGPPGAADTATINANPVSGTYTVTVADPRQVSAVLLSKSEAGLLVANSGSLAVGGAFTFNGGTLTTNGTLAVGGTFQFNGFGILDNSGGGLMLNGAYNWDGGRIIAGTVTASNGGNVTNGGIVNGASTLLKFTSGTWTWSDGNIQVNNGGTFQVESGAIVSLTSNEGFASTGGGTVNNAGVLEKTGGNGGMGLFSGVTLNNTGTLRATSAGWNIQGGTLNNSGVIDISSGSVMFVNGGGTLNLNAGTNITGPGVVELNNGAAVLAVNGSATSAGGVKIVRGRFEGAGTLTVNGSFDLQSFDANTAVNTTVIANNGGNWNTGTPLLGPGSVSVNGGTVSWNGNDITFAVAGANTAAGSLTIGANGTLNLLGDRGFNVRNDVVGSPTVVINGLFKKSGSTSNSNIHTRLNLTVGSTGTIDVQSGSMWLHPAAITNNGVIKASTGNIYFNNNSGGYATATLSGTGTLQVDATGTLNIQPGNNRTVLLSTGTLAQNGMLNVTSSTFRVASTAGITNYNPATTTLTGGTWNLFDATLDLDGRAVTNIAAGTTVRLNGGPSNVTGLNQLTQLTGHLRITNGATFTPLTTVSNGGTVEVSGGTFGGAMTVTNTGVLTGRDGTVNGAVTVQSGGEIRPSLYQSTGNAILRTGDLTLQGGSKYSWEINSWATNAGAGNESNGFDQLQGGVAGAKLNLNGASDTNRVVIKITSLNGSSVGQFSGYDAAVSREWLIADFSNGNTNGGIVGFDANKFTIDTSAFANDPNTTRFTVRTDASANRLYLTFTPVPEPVAPLLVGSALVGAVVYLRRKRGVSSEPTHVSGRPDGV